MKFTSIITTAIITTSSTTDAFSVLQRPNTNKMVNVKTSRRSTKAASSTTTTTSLFDSQMFFATAEDKKAESSNEEEEGEELASIVGSNNELSLGSIYDRLGFQEEQIAIGIEPDQVSSYWRLLFFILMYKQENSKMFIKFKKKFGSNILVSFFNWLLGICPIAGVGMDWKVSIHCPIPYIHEA